MKHRGLHEVFVILLSLFIAFGLTILPLPKMAYVFMPDWVFLIVLYWIIFLPQAVGLTTAWLTGLLVDVLTNSLLGEHAMAGVLAAYLGLKFYRRIRTLQMWQQMVSIMLLLCVYRAVLFWIQGMIQQPLNPATWFAVITGTLLWPIIVMLLHEPQRRWGEL
jgi:rod shape-determining protein MreD